MDNVFNEYTNSVFEKSWWIEAVSGKKPQVYAKVDDAGKVLARFAIPVNKRNEVKMPHFTQTCGIWFDKDDSSFCRNKEKVIDIINSIVDTLPKGKSIDLVLDSSNKYVLPFLWRGFTIKPTFSYRIKGLKDFSGDYYDTFEKVVKKNIKSAKNKVTIDDSPDVRRLYSVMEKSFAIQGRSFPYSIDYISKLIGIAIENNAGKMLTAVDKEGNVHASAFFLYDNKTCYYLMAGADPKYRNGGAQSLLLYEGIKFAQTVSENFDFEGSVIEGIEKFFRGFNPELICNYRVCKLSLIDEIKDLIKPHIKKILGYR